MRRGHDSIETTDLCYIFPFPCKYRLEVLMRETCWSCCIMSSHTAKVFLISMVYPRDTIKELISTPFSQERLSTEIGHVGETSRILVKMLSARQLSPTESNKCLRPTFPALYRNRLR